ncbi:MAG: LysR family transcriptional regulator [Gammaproteobacteria bacterium]|nr:LysR family transcriptional regulator [Gammaproteobacteria bacterium]NIM74850.1 LysR family transcriptional regulator [Gammaproteobacteria bacterium]NIN39442.1 LysR family transcriptional regulator [Gammaproteobacteria bacterium]NIO26768.1 LysR family transcriptional regulator [Gammaproteobacteria bacterium]NIO67324.1 LysR family transcriptional regulator [Gammaproteobacteria bacterium]
MNVTFRQLRVFEAVARHLSFTRAAEELHLTQPAVSMQVKQMEGAVGLPLFELMGRRIHLTEAGEVMHHYCRLIAENLAEAEQAVEELKGIEGGRLHITVASTVNYFATRLLSDFCRQHPGVRVVLDVTNRQGLLETLEANETDIALMGKPPESLDVDAAPFMENPLVVIAAPDHRLAGRSRIALSRLSEETFLMREQGSGTRMAMERFLSDKDIGLTSTVEMTSNEAIKQSVQAGLGLGIVSVHTVELELEVGRLVILKVESFPIRRHWYLVHRKGKRLSAPAAAFKAFVLAYGKRQARRR